jgi:ketosteroid isomerase-like protein
MVEHPNATLVRKGFVAFNAGDIATLTTIIAADASQHMPGHNRFSGDHKGRDEILAMYGQIAEQTGGTFQAVLEDVYANDHRAVAIYRGIGTRNNRTVEERHALCFEILDGRAIEMDDISLNGVTDDAFWD